MAAELVNLVGMFNWNHAVFVAMHNQSRDIDSGQGLSAMPIRVEHQSFRVETQQRKLMSGYLV